MIPSAFAESVPEWVKNTAGWWATDQISETEFVNAVEFLVKENIIQVNVSQTSETSDGVPDGIKNTAGWWATDQISETEFVNAIKFLIESGIINISSYNCDQSEDRDRNGVPDIIDTAPVLSGRLDDLMETDYKFEIKIGVIVIFQKIYLITHSAMLIYHILIFQIQSCLILCLMSKSSRCRSFKYRYKKVQCFSI